MGKIADALKKLQENSDDLSSLPQLVAQVEEIEGNEAMYQQKIDDLYKVNRNYLAQIPVPGQEQQQQEETEKEPTLDDAKEYIIQSLGGNA